MIKQQFLGKVIELIDKDEKVWTGKVSVITSALDSDSEENEIAIEFAEGLVEFKESEIKHIKLK